MSELFNNENIDVAAVLAAAFVYGFMKQGFYTGFICNSLLIGILFVEFMNLKKEKYLVTIFESYSTISILFLSHCLFLHL